MRQHDDIDTEYTWLCAQLGEVLYRLTVLERRRQSLIDAVDALKAEMDRSNEAAKRLAEGK